MDSTTTITPPSSDSGSGKTTDGAKEDNLPPAKTRDRRSSLTSSFTVSGADWREKRNMSLSMRLPEPSTRQRAEVDDEEGKAQFFLTLLLQRYV